MQIDQDPAHSHHPVAHIIVGVADIDAAFELWVDTFGLEVAERRSGQDDALARTWGLPAGAIVDQVLLRTPAAAAGWLHLVQFANPAEPVRRGAKTTALCPKNLDVNCIDMPLRADELAAAGHSFRSAISEYTIGDLRAREVQMPAHDDTNVVLIEVFDWPVSLSSHHYGGITSFVIVVPDTAAEAGFYTKVFGLQSLMQHRITGEAIEKVVGLPPGAALDMRLLGSASELYGRIELINYEGLVGQNLFPRARPPALGALGCRFRIVDADQILVRAAECGLPCHDHGELDALFGRVRLLSLRTPAGMWVEAYQLLIN